MRQHPLDGEMGLAGVGRTKNSSDAGAARANLDWWQAKMKSALRARRAARRRRLHLYHNNTTEKSCAVRNRSVIKVWNESGTNRGRIGDSRRVRLRSLRHMALLLFQNTIWGVCSGFSTSFSGRKS